MFKDFLTALLQRILGFLSTNKDFFELKEADRKAAMEKLAIPNSFKSYLESTSGEDFMADMKVILAFMQDPRGTVIRGNAFFKFFVMFLSVELARKLDFLDSEFYLMDTDKRRKIVDKLLNSESILAGTLKDLLVTNTYQRVVSEIYEVSSRALEVPYLLIQSPRELGTEMRKEIRKEMFEQYPFCTPIFQINKKLIGGIRIFKDGNTVDNSWLQRVLHFTSLTHA